jgi:hypothetical protein
VGPTVTDVTFYITTWGRVDKQVTLEALRPTQAYREERVALVAHPSEVAALEARYDVPVVPCPVQGPDGGLGPTRQWLLDHHEGKAMMLVDDDLSFFKRRTDDPGKFLKIGDEMPLLVERVEHMLLRTPLVGVATRGGANRLPTPVKRNGRVTAMIGIQPEVARRVGARLDTLPVMEDFNFVLTMLRSGVPSWVLTTHCWDTRPDTEGGCSLYRTSDVQTMSAVDLHLQWPQYVRLAKRPAWNGDGHRTDVVIQWEKAFKDSGAPDVYEDPDWSDIAPEWELL